MNSDQRKKKAVNHIMSQMKSETQFSNSKENQKTKTRCFVLKDKLKVVQKRKVMVDDLNIVCLLSSKKTLHMREKLILRKIVVAVQEP